MASLFKKLAKNLDVVYNGVTYHLRAGDMVNQEKYEIPSKYFAEKPADKMVRTSERKTGN